MNDDPAPQRTQTSASLGEREPDMYGAVTLAEIEAAVRDCAATLGLEVRCEQTNHEGAMVDILEVGARAQCRLHHQPGRA